MTTTEQIIFEIIAADIQARPAQVAAAVGLLDDGCTVPFVARYRKEVTGGLDDTQLRLLEERLGYLRELEKRREVILGSIRDQGKLTPELEAKIVAADTKQGLEDLYLPYRPKRRTLAAIAREGGGGSRWRSSFSRTPDWIPKPRLSLSSAPRRMFPTSRLRSTAPATSLPRR